MPAIAPESLQRDSRLLPMPAPVPLPESPSTPIGIRVARVRGAAFLKYSCIFLPARRSTSQYGGFRKMDRYLESSTLSKDSALRELVRLGKDYAEVGMYAIPYRFPDTGAEAAMYVIWADRTSMLD